ncbi:MAG: hypothetical protein IPH37_14135, partial [Burkholderiales bacterium]|nr:hypothetical protein [Burkholderiales bacterium]
MFFTTQRNLIIGTITALLLAACGGGGGAGSSPAAPTPTTLAGTAAVGSPIVGATVTVRCAAGLPLTSQVTNSNGAWSVALSGQVFPCAAQLNGGTINGIANTARYHSIALAAGTMNVTPLTDLMVVFATKRNIPSDWFNGLSSPSWASINASALNAALAVLVNTLQMVQLGSTQHPVTTVFTPAAGNVMDDTLSSLAAALRDISLAYADLRILVASPTVVPSSTLLGALTTRYASSVSGVRASGGVNTTTGLSPNGSPKTAVANCGMAAGSSYLKCQMNAIANFGPLSVVDRVSGKTCTATYTNGTLTVSNG